MNFKSILTLAFLVFLSACNSNSNKKEENQTQSIDTTLVLNEEQKKNISNLELLQGKWQSTDDETNFLKFENDHRMEMAGGMAEWSDEIITLSDKCSNESDKVKE